MPVASSTIRKENLIAKHSSGATVIPTEVKDLGNGNYQYTIARDWNPTTDNGIWEIWTNENFRVLDDSGNPVATQKVGELSVALAGTSNLVIIVPWATLNNKPTSVIRSALPPDFTKEWEIWNQVTDDFVAKTIEVCLFTRMYGDVAVPMVCRTLPLVSFAPSDATSNPDGTFTKALPRGVELNYKTSLDLQNTGQFSATFPAGTLKSIRWEGLDAQDIWVEGNDGLIAADATTFTFNPNYSNGAMVKTRWLLTYSDDKTIEYLLPLVR